MPTVSIFIQKDTITAAAIKYRAGPHSQPAPAITANSTQQKFYTLTLSNASPKKIQTKQQKQQA